MGRLISFALTSLDGFVADRDGDFAWAEPDEEVHTFVNDRLRPAGTHLYGRKMYEVMTWWESPENQAGEPGYVRDFGEIWRAVDKIVYSRTLAEPVTARTRLEREFDPEAVRRLKAETDADLTISGPELAAHAFAAGLVDEVHLILAPVVAGDGHAALPRDRRLRLELEEHRAFGNGCVYLRYAVRT